ncbi:MAG: 3-phosphoshikimate 1-carboxyvinyltransferase, partial [Desulfosudaceae bacterium]
MIEIKPGPIKDRSVSVPGSKSYTHRTLIAAALADGSCELDNCLDSEDTRFTRQALSQMGVKLADQNGKTLVYGRKGELATPDEPIYLGNSGTSMRLLAGLAALGKGTCTLTGNERMCRRPLADLLAALNQLGCEARSTGNTGCPPVLINGSKSRGGRVDLKCDLSSQFLSALLLMAPYLERGLEIKVTAGPVSKPYIDMTVDIMNNFGVAVTREGYRRFAVAGGQVYRPGSYRVEPDASQAGYFWAAAAITGATVKVLGIDAKSRQGDARFVEVLEAMGCRVSSEADGIAVTGGPLVSVEVDMSDMPDMVPTLAVVAAYARGATIIRNVAHLKDKESDRLAVTASSLSSMGITAVGDNTGLTIIGGRPAGADIDPHDDHRIAMSFAVAGLVTPGVRIADEQCVAKSFPGFWEVFE